ncbi:3-deoxy-D-manno-octulosonic acid transferase [Fulvitalea axinellae]|uniref:3-deoxy-D-manno-octulosonic acid transferase n=1 Tax=Fulvitalea axinellae TaxID=1182444 RepID=A0AAU9CGK3_9BACT|nr:3-deoxy-D-manno-octulosonic acid transferase [Fulvitalea axinellae]
MTISKIVYNVAMGAMAAGVRVGVLFSPKTKQFVEGRKGLLDNLRKEFSGNESPLAWFHCASLGEFEQARPVMEMFRKEYPDYKIVLTFFSPSGYEVRKNYEGADYICYLPLDSGSNAKAFLDAINPSIVFFVKYEFWYHYFSEIKRRNIPMILFSAIFRKSQPFFKAYGSLHREMLDCITKIFVQDSDSIALLKKIGKTEAQEAGDTRFDRVSAVCAEAKRVPLVESFKGDSRLMVIGSSWLSDMKVLYRLINQEYENLKFVIAPHNLKEAEMQTMEKSIRRRTIRFSEADSNSVRRSQVMIIDNFGMLSSIYRYADFSYIGGSFNKGLHNTLEAATFGAPIFFGNDETNAKFKEAKALVACGGAFEIADSDELKKKFDEVFEDEKAREEAATASADYVAQNTGASEMIIDYTRKLLAR